MNKTSYYIHTLCRQAAAALAALSLLAACSDTNDKLVAEAEADDAQTPTTTGYMLITLDENYTRSLSYDGVSTTMDDGTLIGCVITSGDTHSTATYYGTAAWKYNASGNYLTIDHWWTYDSTNLAWILHTASEGDTTQDLTYDSSGYTGINTSDYLYFYFYYPFIDPLVESSSDDSEFTLSDIPSVTTESASSSELKTRADDDSSTTTTYLMGMPVGEDISGTSIGSYTTASTTTESTELKTRADATTLSTAFPIFSWKKFPVFINQDQSTLAKHNMSDFLYDAYEAGVNNTTTGTLYLQLRKETATIRVISNTVELSNVKLYVPKDSTSGNIVRGSYINLYADSELSDTPDYNTLANGDSIRAYDNTDNAGSSYTADHRIIIPQQDWQYAELAYTVTVGGSPKNLTTSLSGFGSSLSRSTLYTVEVAEWEDLYCYWSAACKYTSTEPTDSVIVTNADDGVFSWGNYTGKTGAVVQSSSTTYTVNSTTISYYLKFDTNPYLQIVMPVNGTVTLYFPDSSYGSGKTLYLYTYANESYSESYDTLTIAQDTSDTSMYTASFTGTKGTTYRIRRGSAQTNLYYVIISATKTDDE